MRKLFAAIAAALSLFAAPMSEAANTFGTDMSDLWWNPNENGWGANVAHQGEIIFMTLFVYGADNKVKWYVASAMTSSGGSTPFTFAGDLYETTGPFLGAATFNPASVTVRKVGVATFTATGINNATLAYSVDGTQVNKTIRRQTFRNNNLAGNYLTMVSTTESGCGEQSGTNTTNGSAVVTHSAAGNVSMSVTTEGTQQCTFAGSYAQSGRMGDIHGTATCPDFESATFDAYEIEAGSAGFSARFDISNIPGVAGCTISGRFVGMRYGGDSTPARQFQPLEFPLANPADVARLAAFGIPGWSGAEPHNGIDLVIRESLSSTALVSPTAGQVASINVSENPYSRPVGQLLLTVEIRVNAEWTVNLVIEPGTADPARRTAQRNAVKVSVGQMVDVGTPVADILVGELGYPHLHYMVRKNGQSLCAYQHSSAAARATFEAIAATDTRGLPDGRICYGQQ